MVFENNTVHPGLASHRISREAAETAVIVIVADNNDNEETIRDRNGGRDGYKRSSLSIDEKLKRNNIKAELKFK